MKMERDHANKEMEKLQQQVEKLSCTVEAEMSINEYNPFIPSQWRTAILTFENGERVRAKVLMPRTEKPLWHTDLEGRFIHDFNKSQSKAIHKVIKVHILRK